MIVTQLLRHWPPIAFGIGTGSVLLMLILRHVPSRRARVIIVLAAVTMVTLVIAAGLATELS